MLMKFTKLLVLGTALMGTGAAQAASDGVWTKPVPAKATFSINEATGISDTLYLYNQGAKGFLYGANSWSTQGSIADYGHKILVSKYQATGETEWDGQSYVIKDSVLAGSSAKQWKEWFINDSTTSYVDRASQANYFFRLDAQGDNIYRISGSSKNPNYSQDLFPGYYVGLDVSTEPNRTFLTSLLQAGENHFIDWYFVTTTEYNKYLAQLPAYNAALQLKVALDDAKSKNVDVSAQESVYNNTASTAEELNAAIEAVKKAVAQAEENTVSADDPVDETTLLTNPSFDNNDATGWSGTTPGFQSYTNAEMYNKKFNLYQDVKNVPNGVYAVSVQGFYRNGSLDGAYKAWKKGEQSLAELYVKSGTDSIHKPFTNIIDGATGDMIGTGSEIQPADTAVYAPNDMNAAEAYFKAGRFNNVLFFSSEDGQFRLGAAKDSLITNDWTIFDNFTLKYYGKSKEAYTKWAENVAKNAKSFDKIDENTLVTKGLIDEYNTYVSNITTVGTDKASILEAINTRDEKAKGIEDNIAAWKEYQAALVKANELLADKNVSDEQKSAVDDYMLDAEDVTDTRELTTDQLKAETTKLLTMVDDAYKTGIVEGSDVTSTYLTNPDFETGDATGWNGSPTVNGPKANKCAEKYATNFDVYQVVKNAPIGVYKVSLQGFYRAGSNDVAWQAYQDAKAAGKTIACPVQVYVNNNATTINNVYDVDIPNGELFTKENLIGPAAYVPANDDSHWYANDMTNAGLAFAAGYYQSSAFGLVSKQGDELRLGIKGNMSGSEWCIFDNFKMTYQGFKADVIKPELEKAITAAQALESEKVGKTVKSNLESAIAEGNKAVAGTDGKTMFDALVAIYDANDSVTASKEIFADLKAVSDKLTDAISTSTASQTTIGKASSLVEDIASALENDSYENSDATAKIAEANKLLTQLNIPAGAESATDEAPADLTGVIVNPGYVIDGTQTTKGWTVSAAPNFGNDDNQKAAGLIEYYEKNFDIYQDIEGLPAGTYGISVNAFNRQGSTAQDYTALTNESTPEAYLYGTTSEGTDSVAVKHLAGEGTGEDLGYSGTTTYTDASGKTFTVPNDMVSANAYFSDQNLYVNTVFVKVGEDGKLRIGMKKGSHVTSSWSILDNWTLAYYGPNSTKTGINNVESTAGAAKVETYSVNGIKTNGLKRGVNIVKVYKNDGTVSVKKVVVK